MKHTWPKEDRENSVKGGTLRDLQGLDYLARREPQPALQDDDAKDDEPHGVHAGKGEPQKTYRTSPLIWETYFLYQNVKTETFADIPK